MSGQTKARVDKALKIGQDEVSRLEQRSDLLISTLRNHSPRWAVTCS